MVDVSSGGGADVAVAVDEEKGQVVVKRKWWQFGKPKVEEEHEKIKPGWRDVNPFPTMLSIFRQPTNAVVLFASGECLACRRMVQPADTARYPLCRPVHHCLYGLDHPRCRAILVQRPQHRSGHPQLWRGKYGRLDRWWAVQRHHPAQAEGTELRCIST